MCVPGVKPDLQKADTEVVTSSFESLFLKHNFGTGEVDVEMAYQEQEVTCRSAHQPRYCKARSIPYAMRSKVDAELERLEKEGTVQFADWAAPIVPVVKADKKSIRICGDFKLTVNQASRLDRYPRPRPTRRNTWFPVSQPTLLSWKFQRKKKLHFHLSHNLRVWFES